MGGYHSFNVVEQPKFKQFVQELDPKYSLPSEKTVRTTLLDTKFEEIMTKIKNTIDTMPNNTTVCLTTDGWASRDRNLSKYNSLTMTFINPNEHQKETITFGIAPSTCSQTAENCLASITEILERYNMQEKKFIYYLTTDTAAVMQKIIKIVIFNQDSTNSFKKIDSEN